MSPCPLPFPTPLITLQLESNSSVYYDFQNRSLAFELNRKSNRMLTLPFHRVYWQHYTASQRYVTDGCQTVRLPRRRPVRNISNWTITFESNVFGESNFETCSAPAFCLCRRLDNKCITVTYNSPTNSTQSKTIQTVKYISIQRVYAQEARQQQSCVTHCQHGV